MSRARGANSHARRDTQSNNNTNHQRLVAAVAGGVKTLCDMRSMCVFTYFSMNFQCFGRIFFGSISWHSNVLTEPSTCWCQRTCERDAPFFVFDHLLRHLNSTQMYVAQPFFCYYYEKYTENSKQTHSSQFERATVRTLFPRKLSINLATIT